MSGALRQSLVFSPNGGTVVGESGAVGGTEGVDGGIGGEGKWCWRCKLDQGYGVLGKVWVSGLSFMGFVCCGFVDEEEEEVGDTGFGVVGGGIVAPRRVSLGMGEVQGVV